MCALATAVLTPILETTYQRYYPTGPLQLYERNHLVYTDGVGWGHCVLICNIDEDDEGNAKRRVVALNARVGTPSTREIVTKGLAYLAEFAFRSAWKCKLRKIETISPAGRPVPGRPESIARSRRTIVKAHVHATATALLRPVARTQTHTEARVITHTVSARRDACICHKWLDINIEDKRNERRRYIARVNKIR